MTHTSAEKIQAHIAKYGQHVVCVHASDEDPPDFRPFVYTIGNQQIGLPELLLIGQADDLFVRIINAIGEVQRERGTALSHGELVDFTARLPARIVDAGQIGREQYAVQVGVYYDILDFEVRQILLPDRNGKYPGEPGCLPPYANQPVLAAIN